VLGAGYATRLYPLTRERPKPLLPIGGVPMLSRICDCVFEVDGLQRICLVTNHRFVRNYYNWLREYEGRRSRRCPVEIFDDLTDSNDDRLGAIGDMQFVIRHAKIDDDLLVIAGDNLFDFPLGDFVAFGREKGSCIGLKDLGSKDLVSLYGQVELDDSGRVVEFEEKPPRPRSTLVSIGVYFFGKKHVPLIERYIEEGHNADRPGNYIQWLHKTIELYGYVIKGDWFDIGDIDSYNRANEIYISKKK
jgi:glucose-1-phosphate thymidylyltransferase